MTESKKYSRNYKATYNKRRTFRYNYEEQVLEWINTNPEMIEEFGEVVSRIGLGVNNWKNNPQAWVNDYNTEIDEELRYL